jgi:hypothetical protein
LPHFVISAEHFLIFAEFWPGILAMNAMNEMKGGRVESVKLAADAENSKAGGKRMFDKAIY